MGERMTEQLYDLAVTECWHLFPLIPETKRPAVRDWEHAAMVPVTDVSEDLAPFREAIVDHFWPARDSGLACGPTGLVVIDLDTAPNGEPDGVQGLARVTAEHGEHLPFTRTVKTRSGGWQLYYQAIPGREIRNSAGRVAPHVDVRGCGGYVVAPGSYVAADHKPGGWYVIADPRLPVPLPGWLADLADSPRPSGPGRSRGYGAVAAAPRARLRGLLASVIDAPVGKRNSVLYWSASRAAEMVNEELIDQDAVRSAIEEAGICAGLGEAEVRRTIDSAFRGMG